MIYRAWLSGDLELYEGVLNGVQEYIDEV